MARILVLDDSPDIPTLLVSLLQKYGHEVVDAADGSDVQEWVGTSNPDLIVLDVMMPGVDGWETLRRLKEDRSFGHVPVIISSAFSDKKLLARARSLGAIDYVPTTRTADDFLKRILWAMTIGNRAAAS